MVNKIHDRDPIGWIERSLRVHVTSAQRDIADAVAKHRQVAVHSRLGIGNTFILAAIMAWWVSVDPENSLVVSVAPTRAMDYILWLNLHKVHRHGNLTGEVVFQQSHWNVGESLVGIGITSYDVKEFPNILNRATLWQWSRSLVSTRSSTLPATPTHSIGRVLLVFDGVHGIPESLWTSGADVVSNERSRWVALGNGDRSTWYDEFCQRCQPSSGWHTIHVDGYETPSFPGDTGEL